eukprot:TRINITY_DN20884_c0_g1_i1.p1 TRINITY_DN20884_c0_g1~~TRINITY_DN20884_c0_g1_i1.p1  ORF type:complete len:277 (+),score=50.42 TRINITY_DN20884_c0_g1_i1:193-1023(+)
MCIRDRAGVGDNPVLLEELAVLREARQRVPALEEELARLHGEARLMEAEIQNFEKLTAAYAKQAEEFKAERGALTQAVSRRSSTPPDGPCANQATTSPSAELKEPSAELKEAQAARQIAELEVQNLKAALHVAKSRHQAKSTTSFHSRQQDTNSAALLPEPHAPGHGHQASEVPARQPSSPCMAGHGVHGQSLSHPRLQSHDRAVSVSAHASARSVSSARSVGSRSPARPQVPTLAVHELGHALSCAVSKKGDTPRELQEIERLRERKRRAFLSQH